MYKRTKATCEKTTPYGNFYWRNDLDAALLRVMSDVSQRACGSLLMIHGIVHASRSTRSRSHFEFASILGCLALGERM